MPLRWIMAKAAEKSGLADAAYDYLCGLDTRAIESVVLIACGLLRGLVYMAPGQAWGMWPQLGSRIPFSDNEWGTFLVTLALAHTACWVWGMPLPRLLMTRHRQHVSLNGRYICCALWSASSGLMGYYFLATSIWSAAWVWRFLILSCALLAQFHLAMCLDALKRQRRLAEEEGVMIGTVRRLWHRERRQHHCFAHDILPEFFRHELRAMEAEGE